MVHRLSVQSLTAEKTWRQESEAADHIVSIVRMQGRNAVSAQFLFFAQSRTAAHGMALPNAQCGSFFLRQTFLETR